MIAKVLASAKLSKSIYLLACILAALGLGLTMTVFGQAFSAPANPGIIYVRLDGDDGLCNGEFDTDASAAPDCAVRTIEQGINVVTSNGTVNVRPGEYRENVYVDKPISLIGSSPVTITSPAGLNNTLITVEADNVTIDSFALIVNRPSATAGIDARDQDGLTVQNCVIQDTGSRGWFDNPYLFTNVVGIAVLSDDDTAEVVTITNTQIILDSGAYSFYTRGIWLRKAYGIVANNELFGLEQDALLQYPSGGETILENNSFYGAGVSIKEPESGPVTVQNNAFVPVSDSFPQSLLIKNNHNPVAVNVISNTFSGHKIGLYSGASRDVTVHNNTFIPAPDATVFTHTQINTSYPSCCKNGEPISVTNSITLTNNVFQKSTATGMHGTAIEVMNDKSFYAVDFDPITIGGSPSSTNTFEVGLKRTVWLKGNVWNTNPDINAYWNDWGYTTVESIEPTMYHQADDGNLAKIDFYGMVIDAVPTTVPADGVSVVDITTTITGFVTPGAGDTISFTSDVGNVAPPSAVADSNAQATATFVSTEAGTATITAQSGAAVNHIETASVEIDLIPVTDLVVSKSNAETTVVPGDVLAYMITITNTGYHTAYGVVLTDTLPANTTFVATSDGGNETFPGSGEIVWPAFNVGTGSSGTETRLIVVTLDDPVPPGVETLSNAVTIDYALDIDPNNNVYYDIDDVIAAPDLTISKNNGSVTLNPGDTLHYTINYVNVGNQIATSVTITETIPAYTTFDAMSSSPGWTCSDGAPGGMLCTFTIGTLDVTPPAAIDFAVTIVSPLPAGVTQINNTVEIADDGTNGEDPNPNDNVSTETTPVNAEVDLAITKTDGGINAAIGQTVVYTLTYANLGNQIATGVTVADTVPTYTTFSETASSTGWSCTDGAPEGTLCTYTMSEVGDTSGELYFAVDLPPSLPAGVSGIENTVAISDDGTSGPDVNPDNNSDTDATPVGAASDLAIDVDNNQIIAYPDQHLTYVIAVTNQGTQAATNVLITDTLPAELAFAGASNGGIETQAGSGIVMWPLIGNLPSGEFVTRTLHAMVASTIPAGVDEIANVAGVADDGTNGPDVNPENNVATDTDLVDAEPDLVITKTAGSTAVLSGDLLVYTITVSNVGTQGATGIVIADQLPTNSSFYTATNGGYETITGTVEWPAIDLAVGEGAMHLLTIQASVPPEGNIITNTAEVTDDGTNGLDSNPDDNEDYAITAIKPHYVYMPVVLRRYAQGPDLVVTSISINAGIIEVVIENQGELPTGENAGFWVDLYINPTPAPTGVNQLWPSLANSGAAWGVSGVALPINPGQTRTLRTHGPYFFYEYSTLPAELNTGDILYAQVDSLNSETTYGSILENHEIAGTLYNNIYHTTLTETVPIQPAAGGIDNQSKQQIEPFTIPAR